MRNRFHFCAAEVSASSGSRAHLLALLLTSLLIGGCESKVPCAEVVAQPTTAGTRCDHRILECEDGRERTVRCRRRGQIFSCQCLIDGVHRKTFGDTHVCHQVEPEDVIRIANAYCDFGLRYGGSGGWSPL